MLKTFKWLALVLPIAMVAGCGGHDPASRARAFIDALNRDDTAMAESLLTRLAREKVHSDDGKTLKLGRKDSNGNDRKWQDYTVGEAVVDGEIAVVPLTSGVSEKPETMKLKLRKEDGEWRVFALIFPIDRAGVEVTLDLEHPELFAAELLKIVPKALEEGGKALVKSMEALGQGLAKMGEGFARGLTSGSAAK
jgi:hypothetical protein